MQLNKDRRETCPETVAAINLGFATDCNTSGYKLLIEGTSKVVISNQVKFDENLYPYRNRNIIEQNLSELAELDIVTRDNGDCEWIKFTPETNLNDFEKVHSGGSSDSYILRSIAKPKAYMGVKREEFFQSLLSKC